VGSLESKSKEARFIEGRGGEREHGQAAEGRVAQSAASRGRGRDPWNLEVSTMGHDARQFSPARYPLPVGQEHTLRLRKALSTHCWPATGHGTDSWHGGFRAAACVGPLHARRHTASTVVAKRAALCVSIRVPSVRLSPTVGTRDKNGHGRSKSLGFGVDLLLKFTFGTN